MQLNYKLTSVSGSREEPASAQRKRKNKKHPSIWALLLEENLMQPNPVFDETRLLLQSAKMSVAILEEAARVGCDCHFSRRKRRWVLYRRSKWQIGAELAKVGIQIRRLGNRDADYGEISALRG